MTPTKTDMTIFGGNECIECRIKASTGSAVIGKVYYKNLCSACKSKLSGDSSFSSGFQGFDRRRQYEDYAQDTVQPWDANGKPNVEFLRLYPQSAAKQYSKEILDELRRKL